MKPIAPADAELATMQVLNCTAMELFDVVQTCLQTQTVTGDDWEHARTVLSHALATLEQPLCKPPRYTRRQ
jgi:hypothetical protein